MPLKIQNDYLHGFFSIAEVFSHATRLATVVIDIHGKALSECHNFNSFCTLMRADERYRAGCEKCDKQCAFDGLKQLKPIILTCHAGLSLFSMPIIDEGHLYGFIVCGQVRPKYQEYKTIVIDNKDSWMDDPKIKAEWSQVSVVDNNTLVASANLLRFIVDNFEQELQSDQLSAPPTRYNRHYFTEPSRHEKKLQAALRYIDENLYGELSLESVAAHVCLSANYFSRFFKKRQGVNFKTWVNQKKMQKAGELLHDPVHSIDSIARKLHYAQTSYFCRVFRAAHQMSPQSFRHARLSQ
ncbi:helix-turn-helix domain-containing protein [Salmonella enterica subsp. indica]|uniref:PocR ligand-binding domain-containing protein n=1 Tax=Salmonella enterica TaxID=28901 RepID=UPI0009AAD964|nr:PocR ligand-binding domain-containing protein [Salmonella enterica]EAW1720480.1 helix-turn-helix domain-containing protein [Salmonella enterica subsp. indica]ECI8271870.1 helix-turn-helix domain-containing protein [Salmonella enterica subsp. enterica]EDR2773135.1 helix-turn-helix domain-containing protein [Salmonella enterica subsp. enterica serovar Oslo]EEC4250247.1 helix-turn-helix domain-containing protein [Salmonella enterica subsp. diarizonae]ECC3879107.1 helix-turn-helix domain-contai